MSANQQPAPLVAVVTDEGANVVKNARVRFESVVGGGTFENAGSIIEVITDSDGRATARYVLGQLEGLDAQHVRATLMDSPKGLRLIAGFSATAFVPADPGLTTVSGIVLDNQETPIPGITMHIEGTTRKAKTDDDGRFVITSAPVGPIHLVADGSTATVAGEFPDLSFRVVTIPGVDNPLPSPIYMVKLNTEEAVYAGREAVDLTLEKFPGFKLEIAKNSVTFPGGAREGFVSVTSVNASAVPMAPPNGMQPQFIVTIQPTGTQFDPPARLSLPNVDAHQPGAQVEMYSYDHDLEEFVAIGLGTVSEDGSVVRSNIGVGVVKAGWHCGSQPGGSGTAEHCGDCNKCDGTTCVVDNTNIKPEDAKCKTCDDGKLKTDSDKNDKKCGDTYSKRCFTCRDGECGNHCTDKHDPPKITDGGLAKEAFNKKITKWSEALSKSPYLKVDVSGVNAFGSVEEGKECCENCDESEPKNYKKYNGGAEGNAKIKATLPFVGGLSKSSSIPVGHGLTIGYKAEYGLRGSADLNLKGEVTYKESECVTELPNCTEASLGGSGELSLSLGADVSGEIKSCEDERYNNCEDLGVIGAKADVVVSVFAKAAATSFYGCNKLSCTTYSVGEISANPIMKFSITVKNVIKFNVLQEIHLPISDPISGKDCDG